MKDVGDRLYELRKHLDLTQEELGAQLGIKRSSMGKLERNEYLLNSKKLQLLASLYNVSMDYLLCSRGKLFYDKTRDDINKSSHKIDDEMEEMISLMLRVPLVRYSMMSYFQRFKIENREIIEKELEKR